VTAEGVVSARRGAGVRPKSAKTDRMEYAEAAGAFGAGIANSPLTGC
jgi:hypothetical protein